MNLSKLGSTRLLVAGLLSSALAAPATAAIVDGISAPGDLFVNIWDVNKSTSATFNLGVNYNQFTAGYDSDSWNISEVLAGLGYAAGDSLQYSLMAANYLTLDGSYAGVGLTTSSINTNYGGLVSQVSGTTYPQIQGSSNQIVIELVQNPLTQFRINPVNQNSTWLGGTGGNGRGSYQVSTSTSLAYYAGADALANNLIRDAVIDPSTSLAQTLDIWWAHLGTGGSGRQINGFTMSLTPFTGTLTLDPAAQAITWNVPTTTVPVPAAVWLLGSALAGMGVIGRRRNEAVTV